MTFTASSALTPPTIRAGLPDGLVGNAELLDALVLESAGEHLWRVCDRRIARGEGRFMAFIEEKNHDFEVMQVADDFVWTSFPTMRAALTHILQSNAGATADSLSDRGA